MSVQVSTRIDAKTKQQFDAICDVMGISPSSALSLFIKSVINNNGIPFAVAAPPEKHSSKVQYADNDMVREIGERIVKQHLPAFEELAR